MNHSLPVRMAFEYPAKDYIESNLHESILQSIEPIIKKRVADSGSIFYQIRTVIDELSNNAREHGSAPDQNIFCRVVILGSRFIFEIEDTGTGPSHTTPLALRKHILTKNGSTDIHMNKRGRGLTFLVPKIADKLSITKSKKGGIKIHVEKQLA